MPGEATFAAWECEWLSGPKSVYVAFDREDWPMSTEGRRQIEVGTRVGHVQEGTSGHPDACQVEVAYRRFGPERRLVETVELYVERAETTPAENCAEAEAMMLAINDRLPMTG